MNRRTHRRRIAVALTAAAAIGVAFVPAAAEATAASVSAAPPGGGRGWEAVSGEVASTTTPVILRGASGADRIFWVQQDADRTWSVRGREIGSAAAQATTVTAGWYGLNEHLGGTAQGISGGGQRLVFAGHRTSDSNDPMSQGFVYGAASPDGATWTLNTTGTYSATRQAVSTYGLAAAAGPGGDLAVAFTAGSSTHVSYRLIQDPSLPAAPPDLASGDTGSGVRSVSMATRGISQPWLIWSSNGSDAAGAGIHAQDIGDPGSPVLNAPGSARPDGSTAAPLDTQPVGADFVSGSGLWAAYVDAVDPHVVRLWQVGTDQQLTVTRPYTVQRVALSATNATAASNGRLWLAVVDAPGDRPNPSISAFRIQPAKGCFVRQAMAVPSAAGTYTNIWGIGAAPRAYTGSGASDERMWLWANASVGSADRIWTASIGPGLQVKADSKPAVLTGAAGGVMTVRVSDTCDPAPGATATVTLRRAQGGTITLSGVADKQGVVTLTVPKGVRAGSYTITASLAGYTAGTTLLRVRP